MPVCIVTSFTTSLLIQHREMVKIVELILKCQAVLVWYSLFQFSLRRSD